MSTGKVLFGLLLALAPVGASGTNAGNDSAPQPTDIGRYEHIWKQSPFVVETPVVQQSAGLEQRFVLTGVASLDGQLVIFVLDRQSLARVMVSGEKNAQNLELVSVEQNPDPRKASALVRLGSEQAVIHYDPAALTATTQGSDPNAKPAPQTVQNQNLPAVSPAAGAASPPQAAPGSPNPTPPATTRIIRRREINLNH